MDSTLAKAILNEAKTGGYYFNNFPESDTQLSEEAEYFIQEAEKAISEGWGAKNATIMAIANLAQQVPNAVTIDKHNHKFLGLPLPEDLDAHPTMPLDLTKVSELKIRSLYGDFNACLAAARWKLAEASAALANVSFLRDDAYRESFRKVQRIDPVTDKPKSVAVLEQEAKDNENYRDLEQRVLSHNMDTIKLKALVEIYDGNVSVLSREMTFRDMEWQKSR